MAGQGYRIVRLANYMDAPYFRVTAPTGRTYTVWLLQYRNARYLPSCTCAQFDAENICKHIVACGDLLNDEC